MDTVSGDTHMTSTLRRDGVKGKSEMLSGVGGRRGLANVLDVQSLFFLLKEVGFVL